MTELDDLREQVANALAGSNLREVGDDGTSVRPFAAKSPMAFAYADAALSVVAPVLEGLRAENARLSARKQADLDALKERCGRMLATINAHIRLRDEQAADIARLNAEIHELDAQRQHDETLLVALKEGIDRYRQEAGHQRQQADLWAERGADAAAERDRQRESRIAWALEADRLQQERNALSSLLRDMARRVGEVRGEMRFATKHVDAWVKLADRLMSQRDRYRQAVSDQTPATPDDACPKRGDSHCLHYQEGDGACCACKKQPCLCPDVPQDECPRHEPAAPVDEHPWVTLSSLRLMGMQGSTEGIVKFFGRAGIEVRVEPRDAAPSSVQGDTTPGEGDQS